MQSEPDKASHSEILIVDKVLGKSYFIKRAVLETYTADEHALFVVDSQTAIFDLNNPSPDWSIILDRHTPFLVIKAISHPSVLIRDGKSGKCFFLSYEDLEKHEGKPPDSYDNVIKLELPVRFELVKDFVPFLRSPYNKIYNNTRKRKS
jgi:hypothetical protein